MKNYSKEAVKAVTGALIGMLENNVLQDCGTEQFVGWCEDGDIFEGEECEAEAIELMNEIADKVDALTYEYLHTDEMP